MKVTKVLLIALIGISLLWTSAAFSQEYVGPERCLMCHSGMSGWRTSMHANGFSSVLDDSYTMVDNYGIINDYDQNGIDDFHDGLNFNDISSVFDAYIPNAPILGYSNSGGYTITIGGETHRVYLTYGGSGLYKQRYAVKINTDEGESEDYYISPIQYNEKTHAYVIYHADAWYTETNAPIDYSTLLDAATNNRSMAKGCSGCHLTGLELTQSDHGEWIMHGAGVSNEGSYDGLSNIVDLDGDGHLDQMNTGCEQCHGPGGDHASSPSSNNIINPSDEGDLSADQANNLCGMCHSRGKSLPNNTFGFAFDDENLENWVVGDMVASHYTDGGGYWPDGTHSQKHHQQFSDFYKSNKPGFEFHQVRCYECHDVHNEVKHHIREEIIESGITISTENDNNTLCLSCHATHGAFEDITVQMVADYDNNIDAIGSIVSEHTHHAYDPTGNGEGRCTKCHNAKTTKSAIPYDIHSHTFDVAPPQATTFYQENGMLNACAVSCHMKDGLTFGIDFSNDVLPDWTEASDIALAEYLTDYYGPNGSWWDRDIVAIEDDGFFSDYLIPVGFALYQNYPNPFAPSTQIRFDLPRTTHVELTVYNVTGQKVRTMVHGEKASGSHVVAWDGKNDRGSDVNAGVYFYHIEASSFSDVQTMTLIR